MGLPFQFNFASCEGQRKGAGIIPLWVLSVVHEVEASSPSRIAWPFTAPSLLRRTGGLIARSFGVIPTPMRTADDSHALANLEGAPQASL